MTGAAYDSLGRNYSDFRQADPRIEARVWAALGDARSVVNVGAGSGSYEPPDREVVAVEPSAVMIAQNAEIWTLAEYFPAAMRAEEEKMPSMRELEALLPGAEIEAVPMPSRCRDEFTSALWDRPEMFLDPAVLRASSLWHTLPPEEIEAGQARLRADLQSGAWDERHGPLRTLPELDIGLRVVSLEL